ncbi:hypothetical protein Cadr_000009697 [Camelus dromedarius]|uniref:Uncharacterized protein n=1 Tax=Camelus dromedarius TaxID=9838 RepID=A0A5N4DJP8_CAMDR|nr:hypothetical protein Cadr_000009697 [Camelus dromedarius]
MDRHISIQLDVLRHLIIAVWGAQAAAQRGDLQPCPQRPSSRPALPDWTPQRRGWSPPALGSQEVDHVALSWSRGLIPRVPRHLGSCGWGLTLDLGRTASVPSDLGSLLVTGSSSPRIPGHPPCLLPASDNRVNHPEGREVRVHGKGVVPPQQEETLGESRREAGMLSHPEPLCLSWPKIPKARGWKQKDRGRKRNWWHDSGRAPVWGSCSERRLANAQEDNEASGSEGEMLQC